jgi:hypothetical protein
MTFFIARLIMVLTATNYLKIRIASSPNRPESSVYSHQTTFLSRKNLRAEGRCLLFVTYHRCPTTSNKLLFFSMDDEDDGRNFSSFEDLVSNENELTAKLLRESENSLFTSTGKQLVDTIDHLSQ